MSTSVRSRLKIASLGVMAAHKGADLLISTAAAARRSALPYDFQLIGYFSPERPDARGLVREYGPYEAEDLKQLLDVVRPAVIWFPVRWPETFSYTLSAAIASDGWIVAPEIGAFPERLRHRPQVFVYPWDADVQQMLETFERVYRSISAGGIEVSQQDGLPQVPASSFYTASYLRPCVERRAAEMPTVAGAISAHSTGQLEACGYIRLDLPLRHPSLAARVRFRRSDGTQEADAAAVIVQRVAIRDVAVAERLVARCRSAGRPLVYEIDDDLFHLPSSHPEFAKYRVLTEPAKRIAGGASMIVTSTEPLARVMSSYGPTAVIVPNALDERLWFDERTASASSEACPDGDELRILYMGSPTHREDLEILRAPLKCLQREFGRRIRLEVIGVAQNHAGWYDVLSIPPHVALSYPNFVRWLRQHKDRWSIGVCPLVNDDFNASKSFIKYLDYAALGLPVVASRAPAYEPLMIEGAPGTFVSNATHEWVASLARLIIDPERRGAMGEAAKRHVSERHTLGAQSAERAAKLEVMLSSRDAMMSR